MTLTAWSRVDGMKRLTPARRGGIHCPTERTRSQAHEEGANHRLCWIDLHKKESQICRILSEDGQLSECCIRTESQRFDEVLGGRPRARILLEASTESEWVARCLEALGHEVVVADPNFAPMYAMRTREVRRDLPTRRPPDRGPRLHGQRLAEVVQFALTPHEPGQAARRHGVEPRAQRPRTRQLVDLLHRSLEALDGHRAQRLRRHVPFSKSERVGRQQHRARGRELLHPCG
jgi:hypothetical protein